MTFDEINSICVAIIATDVKYDFFSKKFLLIFKPEYGYDESIKEKTFKITFNNCIYFIAASSSKMAITGQTEFTSWGKHTSDLCDENNCINLLNSYLSDKPGAGFEKSFLRNDISDKKIDHYYFYNRLGDDIDLLAESTQVDEI